MSHKDLLKWLKKNRKATRNQITDLIYERLSVLASYFTFWKDKSKNKRRLENLIRTVLRDFKSAGYIDGMAYSVNHGSENVLKGRVWFKISDEWIDLNFNIEPV